MVEQMLLIEEFAERARISRQTAYALVKNGGIPGAFRIGKQWRIPAEVFEKLSGDKEMQIAAEKD